VLLWENPQGYLKERINQDALRYLIFHKEKLRRMEYSWTLEPRAFQEVQNRFCRKGGEERVEAGIREQK
jgi:hypothetical protein